MQNKLYITIEGKIYQPNKRKTEILNKLLINYMEVIREYAKEIITHKQLPKEVDKQIRLKYNIIMYNSLITTARDKAWIYMKLNRPCKKLPKRCSIRFDDKYKLTKTGNSLTPYWLTLNINEYINNVNLPIIFGDKQKQLIEEYLVGKWQLISVELVKKQKCWYAQFVLKKFVKTTDNPQTSVGITGGFNNLAVAVAIDCNNPSKPLKGQFWSGAEIKRIRGKIAHIRRNLIKKHKYNKICTIGHKERNQVNNQLHIIANQIIEYVKQFENPVIILGNSDNLIYSLDTYIHIRMREHTYKRYYEMIKLYRQLQQVIEYKALMNGIGVVYLTQEDTRYTSMTCHRCGYVTPIDNERTFKCSNCGMVYNRDLNASINIARKIMGFTGCRSCETRKPTNDDKYAKAYQHVGSSDNHCFKT